MEITNHELKRVLGVVKPAIPRTEAAALFANNSLLGDAAFEPEWYWLGEQTSDNFALRQGFFDGSQTVNHKSNEYCARAVRRFNLSKGA